jgi:uncharacterized protein YndB with AHSA1/START domain
MATDSFAVVHDTVVLERSFPVLPATVFSAFADAAQRACWSFPGDHWELETFEQDFRVGGREESRFGPPGAATLHDVGTFLDIVPGRRIVSAGTMHQNGVRISLTLCTFEFTPEHGGTLLKVTDQSAFLDGRERPDQRRQGWGRILERLAAHLERVGSGSTS